MDVTVKHGSTDITNHVIQYEREHKICTGIGMLELEVEYTYSGTFDPWDVITIYENGQKSGQYYVSSASEGQPNSTINISAQDNSKRLSDYFISDSYTIDYPSYNKFWIQYFLDEVGISYQFLTSEPGALLSNSTALGLMTAYEQIMMLVQLSGWYFTFDYNGKMLIGKASSSFGAKRGTYTNHDIIEIQTIKSDRMLRNRVVIWGKGDPESGRWVFADVTKHTQWDYDNKDKRTIVISNSNIRKTIDAFSLANKALLEFARITVEKHVQLAGAKNLVVGDIIGIKNLTFTGAGKVTTFGTAMSRTGLVTNVILDERCPRLFGFYDIGGYVYVGTYGSGVWRKPVLPQAWSGGQGLIGFASGIFAASGWFDYSAGLEDLQVTDLHINASVLACITTSGQAYTSLEDETPWIPVNFSGLTVSMSGLPIFTDDGFDTKVYDSELMGRACIVDRSTNNAKIAVDTRVGLNYGDFLMETDPLSPLYWQQFSYTVPTGILGIGSSYSGGLDPNSFRSWVLDVSAYSGILVESFPVHVSGNYKLLSYDIENDGSSDYTSNVTLMSGIFPQTNTAVSSTVGINPSIAAERPFNDGQVAFIPYSGYPALLQSASWFSAGGLTVPNQYSTFDDAEHDAAFYVGKTGGSALQVVHYVLSGNTVSSTRVTTSATQSGTWTFLKAERPSSNLFRCYMVSSANVLETWDFTINLTGPLSGSLSRTVKNSNILGTGLSLSTGPFRYYIGDNYYVIFSINTSPNNGFIWYISRTNIYTGANELREILDAFGTGTSSGQFQYIEPTMAIDQLGTNDVIAYLTYFKKEYVSGSPSFHLRAYKSKLLGFSADPITSEALNWFGTYPTSQGFPETSTQISVFNTTQYSVRHRWNANGAGGDKTVYVIDFGDSEQRFLNGVNVPDAWNNLYNPLHQGNTLDAFAQNTINGDFYVLNYDTGSATLMPEPSTHTILNYVGKEAVTSERIFLSTNNTGGAREFLTLTDGGLITRRLLGPSNSTILYFIGNFAIGSTGVFYSRRLIQGSFPVFYILQREGYDFNVVHSGLYRERIEISNYAPLVAMDRRISSLATYYVSPGGEVTTTSNIAMSGYTMSGVHASGSLFSLGIVSDDFRYSTFEMAVESGYPQNLYVVFSGQLGSIDLNYLDSMSGIFSTSSGYVTRVELSNYVFPDQYTFVSLSGHVGSGLYGASGWGFLQKDPNGGVWTDYSDGYPQARTTIIRFDDVI